MSPFLLLAQSQYDYYDDDAVAGGVDGAINGIIWTVLVVVFVFICGLVFGFLQQIYYWFNPEADPEYKQKKAKEKEKKPENYVIPKVIGEDSKNKSVSHIVPSLSPQEKESLIIASPEEIAIKNDVIPKVTGEEIKNKSVSHIVPSLSLQEIESLIIASPEEIANKKNEDCDCKQITYYSPDYKKFIEIDFHFNGLSSLIIKNGTETICSDAIKSSIITDISLPKSIMYIGERSFYCRYLSEITLPDSLRYIGKSAFWFCDYIKEIIIPPNVSFIGERALPYKSLNKIYNKSPFFKIFENCLYTADMKRLIKCFSNDKEIKIPNGVVDITGAFAGCTKIHNVILPESLLNVGDMTFLDCRSLENIILPEGIKSIGDWCFCGCSNLRYVQMPNSLEIEVSDDPKQRIQLFRDCDSLKYVFIPHGLKKYFSSFVKENLLIESTPEEYFNKIESQKQEEKFETSLRTEVTENDKLNGWSDEFNVRYSKDKERLLYSTKQVGYYVYPSSILEYKVKDGTKIICNEAFSSGNLNRIILPESIECIGDGAFASCNNLTQINIPDNVESIGQYAFQSCSSLKSINLPRNLKKISRSLFYWCSSLSNITIPSTVEEIDDNSFFNCDSLKEIHIPDNVKCIGNNAFGACDRLKKIVIPKSVKEIKGNPFTATILGGRHYIVESESSNYIIVNGSLYSSDRKTLVACLSNDSIFDVMEGTTCIGKYAFSHCSKLLNIKLPSSLERIEEYAFEKCRFTMIQIPHSVKYIGDYAFSNCANLSKIILPEGLEYLGERAFYECKSLPEITLPKALKHIKEETFACCDNLTRIAILSPSVVIDKMAFSYLDSLEQVVFYGYPIDVDEELFEYVGIKEIIVPKGMKHKFRTLFPSMKNKIVIRS